MAERPNLFKYATSELSQDAFLCWLLEWADHSYAKVDSVLHQTATDFLWSIGSNFKTNPFEELSPLRVKIRKQHGNKRDGYIDVLALISDGKQRYALVIEDKTDSTMHSDQLTRYLEIVREEFASYRPLPIYLKTGDVSNATKAEEDGYTVYSRKNFLSVLEKNVKDTEDSIIRDYYHRLRKLDNDYRKFRTRPVDKWIKNWRAWEGFFCTLQEKMGQLPEWEFVNNASGGEYVFHWGWRCIEYFDIYPAIIKKWDNNGNGSGRYFLAFKVGNVSQKVSRGEVRNNLHDSLMEQASNFGWGGKVKKPERFGNGENMVIGEVIDQEIWLAKSVDGILDIVETIKNLNEAKKLLDRVE